MTKLFRYSFFIILLIISLLSCSTTKHELAIDYETLLSIPKQDISYQKAIKPILGKRCVVCHGCYDAPCQLKLSSIEGLERGASKESIYDQGRTRHADPSRLFIDAKNTPEWRIKGFFPVINEIEDNHKPEVENLKNSLLYHMLYLKQAYPQSNTGKLNSDFNLKLNEKQQCVKLDEFEDFANQHPLWGMPYGMPNLLEEDYQLLVQWIAQGSPANKPKPLDKPLTKQIKVWENFFNNKKKLKHQLSSRYIFEHLYLSHLYFPSANDKVEQPIFFRLVRSTTPTGQPVNEIPATRPYDSPGKQPFYYRFKRVVSQTVVKNHRSYALSEKKLQRYKQLFIDVDYQVKSLPEYDLKIASNPLKIFKDIPVTSRYQFLLDDAHFFIEGFIKGPVCRGQISLNVIDDYFWVTFINPDMKIDTLDKDFLNENINFFQLPGDGDDRLDIWSIWTKYWKNQKKYINSKIKMFKKYKNVPIDDAMHYIYNGKASRDDVYNPNAALTIFRHFDSASVSYGLINYAPQGKGPATTLVVDYPIFERIHYLLVAGYNVFGNITHQLSSRVYMDFLRMEGEDNFLAFLPVAERKKLHDSWYKGIRQKVKKYFKTPEEWLSMESVSGYQTNQPKRELYEKLKKHFQQSQALAMQKNYGTKYHNLPKDKKIKELISQVNSLSGNKLEIIPDVTFLRIKMNDSKDKRAFTIINNKAHMHLNSLFEDDLKSERRDYNNDSLIMLDWLEGSYPNFFLDVNYEDLGQFSTDFMAISSNQDYERFVALYGIRRTNSKFWELSDWFYQYYKESHPVQAGYFDLNRYKNK